jgi:hypothetical protein
VSAVEGIAVICSALDQVDGAGRGDHGAQDQHSSDDDDDPVQPAVSRGLSSTFFGLTQLFCAFIILNLFSLCFVRLLFLLFYRCFGAISLIQLSCSFVILNLFSPCFVRLLFLLFCPPIPI